MPEAVEKDGKSVEELEEEFAESLRQAAEGESSGDIDAIRGRIERKRERSGSGQ